MIEFNNLTSKNINSLFENVLLLKSDPNRLKTQKNYSGQTAALLFFEPSTRTRFSFETACVRSGVQPLVLSGAYGTSLEKGETMEDTLFNIEAMRPLFFVVRASDKFDFYEIEKKINIPILNAGWGMRAHPTQALLDQFTLFEKWGSIQGKKLLFVGDIRHSRVVSSHIQLSQLTGIQLGFCSFQELLPQQTIEQVEYFDQLPSALSWADAVVALRVQKERHGNEIKSSEDFIKNYVARFGLNEQILKNLNPQGLILHPGPINYGVEIEKNVLTDSRSMILRLVENGVFIREALIRQILKEVQ